MGYVPEWARANHAKVNGNPKPDAQSTSKYGIVSRPIFHSEVKNFADGGDVETNANGDTVGQYSGDDEIVKYRMNQIDDKGNDLRIPTSAKTTQSQMDVQDMENGSGPEATPTSQAAAQDKENGASQSYAKSSPVKSSAPKASAPVKNDSPEYNIEPRDHYQMSSALKSSSSAKPAEPAKPYIDIPKRAAGVQQYRSDAESPIETLIKKMSTGSQRTRAAKKSKDD